MDWTLPVQELEKAGLVEKVGLGVGEYTIKIKRGDEELGRGIILDFYTPKEVAPPPPR